MLKRITIVLILLLIVQPFQGLAATFNYGVFSSEGLAITTYSENYTLYADSTNKDDYFTTVTYACNGKVKIWYKNSVGGSPYTVDTCEDERQTYDLAANGKDGIALGFYIYSSSPAGSVAWLEGATTTNPNAEIITFDMPSGVTDPDPATGGGTGGTGECIGCELFNCPGWDEYMGKVDQILAAIPAAPNWDLVSVTFAEEIAPRIKNDMREVMGDTVTNISNNIDQTVNNQTSEVKTKIDDSTTAINTNMENQTTRITDKLDDSTTSINTNIQNETKKVTDKIDNSTTAINTKTEEQTVRMETAIQEQTKTIQDYVVGYAPPIPDVKMLLDPIDISMLDEQPDFQENQALQDNQFTLDSLKTNAPEVDFREDDSCGFNIVDPVDALPDMPTDELPIPNKTNAGEWEQHKPTEQTNPFPIPTGQQTDMPTETAPIPAETTTAAPTPESTTTETAPIPEGSTNDFSPTMNYKTSPD